ncbi:MAG: arsenate reductase ArsC [Thermovirgaceae bacterium]
MTEKIRVLFLCTGNSCRSQMAEGWAKALKDDEIDAFSAGTRPAGINPKAIQVMAEAGVDMAGQQSTHVEEYLDGQFDVVITLCGDARDTCPVFPGAVRVIHRGFDDPARAEGTKEEILEVFRRVRDEIRDFVSAMPGNLME